jgi:hypothetical protein
VCLLLALLPWSSSPCGCCHERTACGYNHCGGALAATGAARYGAVLVGSVGQAPMINKPANNTRPMPRDAVELLATVERLVGDVALLAATALEREALERVAACAAVQCQLLINAKGINHVYR